MIHLILCFFLLASATTANKLLLATYSPTALIAIRMIAGGLLLWVWQYRKNPQLRFSYLKQDLPVLILIALITTLIPSWCKAYALAYLPAAKVGWICSMDPLLTALYSYILLQETLNWQKIAGIAIALAGAFFLFIKQTGHSFIISVALPELAALASMALGRLGWMGAQQLLKKQRYTPASLNAAIMTIAGIMAAIPLLGNLHYFATLIPGLVPSGGNALLFIHTIVIGNVIAYTYFGSLLKRYSSNFLSVAGFMVPIFITLFSLVISDQQPTINMLIAGILMFSGTYLFFREESRTVSIS